MQLQQLRSFVKVVDAGGLTRAAEQMAITQPAVTRQVAQLEAELGTRLIVRRGRRLQLTASGEVLYHYARRIGALVDDAAEAVRAVESPGRGVVRVGAVSTLGLTVLPSILARFAARYTAMRVRVRLGDVDENIAWLLAGEMDAAVVTMPVTHGKLVCLPLFRDPVHLVATPNLARLWPRPLPLAALSQLDFISYQAPSRFRTFVDSVLEQHGVLPRVLMEFNSQEAVRAMVLLGLGAAFMPQSVAGDDVAAGRLVVVPVEELGPLSRVASLLLLAEGHATAGLRAFAEMVGSLYAPPAESWPGWLRPIGASPADRPASREPAP